MSSDEQTLNNLGYKQEFKREFSLLETMAFSFSIMGVIASVSSTMSYGLAAGHLGLTWGWFIPGVFVLPVALSMAELASSMPTSGGLYYWAAALAPSGWSAYASWATGYANVIGQIALVSSIDFTASELICSALTVASDFERNYSLNEQYGIFLAILCFHAIVACSATKILARLNLFYVVINLGATVATIIIFCVAPGSTHVSSEIAWGSFENGTTWGSGVAFLLSFTAPMWTFTGYDSAAHIAEETSNASRVAPIAIISSVVTTWLLGFAILVSASYAILDIPDLLSTTLQLPMAQLYYNLLGKNGMLAIWSFVIITQIVTGAAQLVDASRVVFSFSRDGALPFSRLFKQIHPKTRTPINAVLIVALCSGLLGLLALSAQAGAALFDVSVLGLYISYATPILLRITSGRAKFIPGPFNLGKWSPLIGSIAVAWVSFVVVILLFPAGPAPDATTMNYAVVILGTILGGSSLWFWISARHWFHGPVKTFASLPASPTSSSVDDKEKDPMEADKEKHQNTARTAVVAVL